MHSRKIFFYLIKLSFVAHKSFYTSHFLRAAIYTMKFNQSITAQFISSFIFSQTL